MVSNATLHQTTLIVSAPAKVILFGEHSVVYGEPCIAATLNKRTFGFTCLNSNEDDLSLECIDIGLVYSSSSHNQQTTLYGLDQKKAIQAFLTLTEKLGISKGKFIIRSEIPVGAGLGSSASFSVVLATLLCLSNGHIDTSDACSTLKMSNQSNAQMINNQSNAQMNINQIKHEPILLDIDRKNMINNLAFLAEKIIHGEPSGVDNTLCTFGGAKMFQKNPTTKKVTLIDLEGFSLFQPRFLLINTKVPKNTMHQVQKYKQRLQDMPQVMNHITQAIGAITRQCALYFQENRNQLPSDIEKKFATCIDMNHQLLVAAGMSCKALNQVHFHATSVAGHSSKITGAGGGGCALCYLSNHPDLSSDFSPSTSTSSRDLLDKEDTLVQAANQASKSSKQYIIDTLSNLGMECFETTLGVNGVSALALSLSNQDGITWFLQSTFPQLDYLTN